MEVKEKPRSRGKPPGRGNEATAVRNRQRAEKERHVRALRDDDRELERPGKRRKEILETEPARLPTGTQAGGIDEASGSSIGAQKLTVVRDVLMALAESGAS